MKLPYGISDFRSLREQGYFYADKTPYIEQLESFGSKYLFFIRPRRFGKSLFLSTLANYYDVERQELFSSLFRGLYISSRPTPLKNSYLVLELDFSGLNTDGKDALEKSFRLRLIDSISGFLDKYTTHLGDVSAVRHRLHHEFDASSMLNALVQAVHTSGKKLYLIIDEYDHFANDMIAVGETGLYKGIVRASGFVRDFYETVKIGTKTAIDRIFITGISPIMLDDLTSGFNIAANVTMNASLHGMMGFHEETIRGMIEPWTIETDREKLVTDLRKNYNGYLFSKEAQSRVYNPDMVLFFFDQWQMNGAYPDQLIDDNIKTDYGRLQRLIANDRNRDILDEIIKYEGITADIVSTFSFDRMYDEHYFISLLFYMGLLTIERQEKTRLRLVIPNYVIKTMFWEHIELRLRSEYKIRPDTEQLRRTIEEMAFEGRIAPFLQYVCKHVLRPLSNRDLMRFDEKVVKVVLFAYLTNSRAYKPVSERETENGYIDVYLEKDPRIPDIRYEWLLELKVVKQSERNSLDAAIEQGKRQLDDYAASRDVIDRPNLKKALAVFIGKEEVVVLE